jgi:hypothetical protein
MRSVHGFLHGEVPVTEINFCISKQKEKRQKYTTQSG